MIAGHDSRLKQAFELHCRGAIAQAASIYRELLHDEPHQADALHLLGVAETQSGQAQKGLDLIDESLRINPRQPVAIANRGSSLLALGDPQAALASYEAALELTPGSVLAHCGRGNALMALGRSAEALASFERALEFAPDLAQALVGCSSALLQLKRLDDAVAMCDRALLLQPDNGTLWLNRGMACAEMGNAAAALAAFDRALLLNPQSNAALFGRGMALIATARIADAIAAFRRLTAADPSFECGFGACLHHQLKVCDWVGYHEVVNEVLAAVDRGLTVDHLGGLYLAVCESPARQLKWARKLIDRYRPQLPALWGAERYAHDRIRVAYVSADFLDHPTSRLMAGLFEKHDRSRFEVFAFSLRDDENSPMARRLRSAFEHFIPAGQRSDADIAAMIRDFEIDILVDLMGFTNLNRAGIFAHRPAPIQVNYLGFPGTLGTVDADYIIADDYVIPAEQQDNYSETVVYLPDCFQANDDQRAMAADKPTRSGFGLPESAIVWSALHSSYKINPPLFDVWARLLAALPESVLWLVGGNREVERNLRREAEARGVDPRRLVFAERIPYAQHLARLPLADLCLDTFPYNGGATSSDALWAGVPVVTCSGRSFSSRMAGSLLRALQMPELIAETLDQYEQIALELARTPGSLAGVRGKLRRNAAASPLFKTDHFRQSLETAFDVMVERCKNPRAELAGRYTP